LLELNGLEDVNKYSSPSSLLVVKLISVESMDSAFLFLLLAVVSGFNCLLSALVSTKSKAKDFFPGPALSSKQNLAIDLQSAVLVTIPKSKVNLVLIQLFFDLLVVCYCHLEKYFLLDCTKVLTLLTH
jgi:hypothetical protein